MDEGVIQANWTNPVWSPQMMWDRFDFKGSIRKRDVRADVLHGITWLVLIVWTAVLIAWFLLIWTTVQL